MVEASVMRATKGSSSVTTFTCLVDSGSPIQWRSWPQALQVDVFFLRAMAFIPGVLGRLGVDVDDELVEDAPPTLGVVA